MRTRIIPCLLLKNRGLVKTVRFASPTYLGDPVNVVRIFNDKEVDEIVLLDIMATPERRTPNLDLVAEIASECFMPMGYGGGVRDLDTIRAVLATGVEKVIINTKAAEDPDFVRQAADQVGSQSLVVSIDVRRTLLGGQQVVTRGGRTRTRREPVEYALQMEASGAGELMVTSVDRDGTFTGYDLDLIRRVSQAVRIPVIACGGAATNDDLRAAVLDGHASAAAAGSMFVFQGRHRAVLITYPGPKELDRTFVTAPASAETR